jgi:hypothetical protein
MDLGVFLESALVLLVRVEIVEDDVKLAVREGGNDAVHEPRNWTRRRRLECAAMILPVAISSAANRVVVPCRL